MSTPDSWTDSTGEWLTASNWSDGIPNANSAVTLDISGTPGTISYDPGNLSEPAIFSLQTNGGVLDVVSGTLDILNGNSLVMYSPLINAGTFELSGGPLTIDGEITNSGLVEVASDSNATASLIMETSFDLNTHGSITVGAHGIAEFGAVPAVQSVTLTSSTAQLLLNDSVNFDAPISGFSAGNTIDFPGQFYAVTDTIQYSPQPGGGRLTIDNSSSAEVATILLKGTYSQSQFQIGDYGDRSLELLVTPCYAAGTRIATPHGEVAVEALRVGDAVLTAAGEAKPIVWIGQRRVDCRRHPRPERVLPIRVHAGAFGERLPHRDLLLSPDHAVFVDGMLIPIKHLDNGLTIAQGSVERVHYFHIELERHDVLLAEGLPAESYLDTGNRAQFEQGAVHTTLHPDFSPLSWDDACAPLCLAGPALGAAKRHLRDRAAVPVSLEVVVDERIVRPAGRRGRMHSFLLPQVTREMCIRSRTGLGIGAVFANGRHLSLEGAAGSRRAARGEVRLVLPAAPRHDDRILLEVGVLARPADRRSTQCVAGDSEAA